MDMSKQQLQTGQGTEMADRGIVNMSSIPSFDAVLFNPKSIENDEGHRSEAVIKSSSQILEDNSQLMITNQENADGDGSPRSARDPAATKLLRLRSN